LQHNGCAFSHWLDISHSHEDSWQRAGAGAGARTSATTFGDEVLADDPFVQRAALPQQYQLTSDDDAEEMLKMHYM
jgi:hypothetical protein